MPRKKSTENTNVEKKTKNNSKLNKWQKFLNEAFKKHGNKYDYSNAIYINNSTHILISCPTHGEFWQLPSVHLHGHGCPKCAKIEQANKRRHTKEYFIELAQNKHGNKFDYSKVIYESSRKKICIICPIHGDFWQSPYGHLNYGCPKCSVTEVHNKQRYTTDIFIQKAQSAHGDKYDYTKVNYIDSHTKVEIICPKHGSFFQNPHSHLLGIGCAKCGHEYVSLKNRSTAEEFIIKAKQIHGNEYNYDKVNYVNSKTPVCIICPKHGEFWQIPNTHLMGSRCPKCNLRKSQLILYNKLKSDLEIDLHFDYKLSWLGRQSLDIYNEQYNFAIEYNGPQHYNPINYFGGESTFKKVKDLDKKKAKLCKLNNCKLWIVKYDYSVQDYTNLLMEIKLYIDGKKS